MMTINSIDGRSLTDLDLGDGKEGKGQNKHMKKESMDIFTNNIDPRLHKLQGFDTQKTTPSRK